MEDNIKTFLSKIQEISDNKISIDCVSGKKLECTPLTFKQQKDLISTIGDGASGVIKFQKLINDIVSTNTGTSELSMVDKLPVIIKLRIDTLGKILKIGDSDIDLEDVLLKVTAIKYKTSKKISGSVIVDLHIPTLAQESKIISALLDSVKKETDTDMGKNIGNVYTYEIIKYINKVKIGECELSFLDIPIKDRFKIVENLPLTVNKEIIRFIQDLKDVEREALTVNVDGEDKSIDIDVSFFDS